MIPSREEVGLGVTNGTNFWTISYLIPCLPSSQLIPPYILLQMLMVASSKAVSVPNIYLSGEIIHKVKMRKDISKDGKLNI